MTIEAMTNRDIIKLAGFGLIASGFLVAIGFSVHPHDPLDANHGMWIGSHIVIISGFLASLFGLVGLYAVVAKDVGMGGLLGFVLAAISLFLYLGKLYWSGFIYPLVLTHHPGFIADFGFAPGAQPSDPIVRAVFYLGPILFGAGYSFLGGAMLKARSFPRLPVGLLVAGALLVGLWPLLPDVVQHFSVAVSLVFTAGAAWLGYLLIAGRYPGVRRGVADKALEHVA